MVGATYRRAGPYAAFTPTTQPQLTSVGHLRVRIGGVDDPPSTQLAAFVVVGLNGKRGVPSQPLPHAHSALLPQDAWQQYMVEMAAEDAANTTLRLEIIGWLPGRGEQSFGQMTVGADSVLHGGGRLELLGPLGIAIEVDWLPPVARRGDADVLVGSNVRCAASESELERARERVWYDGCEPTPSFPSSVGGLPPTAPPKPGHRWVWGHGTWHEVPTTPSTWSKIEGLDDLPLYEGGLGSMYL